MFRIFSKNNYFSLPKLIVLNCIKSKKNVFFLFLLHKSSIFLRDIFRDASKIISKIPIELDYSTVQSSIVRGTFIILFYFQSDLWKLLEEKIIIAKRNFSNVGKSDTFNGEL